MHRRGLPLALAATLAALLLAPATAAAGDRERDLLSPEAVEPERQAEPLRDRTFKRSPLGNRYSTAAQANTYFDRHGHRVRVEVSDSYAPNPAADQALVDFLGSLLHRDELSKLYVFVATPGEVAFICGAFGILACYGPNIMVIPGEEVRGQPPLELIVAHEYGHQVAFHANNAPWDALFRGPKRWSSYEDVCRGLRTERLSPHIYRRDPGEAFAEAYAFLHFPNVIPWGWHQSLRPDRRAFRAIVQDVANPWSGRRWSAARGRLAPGERHDRHGFATPLDGDLTVKLRVPRGADFDLALYAKGDEDDRFSGRGGSRNERVESTVCGQSSFQARVLRWAGAGPYRLNLARP